MKIESVAVLYGDNSLNRASVTTDTIFMVFHGTLSPADGAHADGTCRPSGQALPA